MTELALAVLFTAAGIGAAWLALRAAGDSPVVRWMARGFVVLALGNLVIELWPMLTADPEGARMVLRVAVILALAVWGYARLLGLLRRRVGQGRDDP